MAFKFAILLLLILFLGQGSAATLIAEDIAIKLEQAVAFATDYNDQLPDQGYNTNLRRYEDGLAMWIMLYENPAQNRHFPDLVSRGFLSGENYQYFSGIPDISYNDTLAMDNSSPWSYKLAGIGQFIFYREAYYHDKFYTISKTNDRPHKATFGTSDNGVHCKPPRIQNSYFCGKQERIGSIKFCPGIAFYQKEDYRGSANTKFECDLPAGGNHCFEGLRHFHRRAKSLHFDGSIKEIRLYKNDDCSGKGHSFYFSRTNGLLHTMPKNLKNHIRSIRIFTKEI